MIALPPVPQPRAGGAGGTKGLPDLAEPWGKRDSPGAKGQQRLMRDKATSAPHSA